MSFHDSEYFRKLPKPIASVIMSSLKNKRTNLKLYIMIKFFTDNYEWMFSGIISGLIFWVLGQKKGYNKAIKQSMKLGNHSKGIQVGGNYTEKTEKQ